MESLIIIVSKLTGLSLYGRVSVDGHVAPEAGIFIGGGSIDFEGSLEHDLSFNNVTIQQPSLAVSIQTMSNSTRGGFTVQFSGIITVNETHHFDVLVYLSKTNTTAPGYTVYGSYDGEFYLHDLSDSLKSSDLLRDISIRKLAICVSNVDSAEAMIKTKPLGYDIGRGLTIYGEVCLPAVSNVLNVDKGTSFVVCASYQPSASVGDVSKFKIGIRIVRDKIVSLLHLVLHEHAICYPENISRCAARTRALPASPVDATVWA